MRSHCTKSNSMQQSKVERYIFERDDFAAKRDLIQTMCCQNGFILNKLEFKSTIKRTKFRFNLVMCRLEWCGTLSNSTEGYFDIRDLKEIRIGTKLFAILYGNEFRLNKLSFKGLTVKPGKLSEGLNYIKTLVNCAPYRVQIEIMLQREFEYLSTQAGCCKVVFLNDMKKFVSKLHFKQSTELLKQLFDEVVQTIHECRQDRQCLKCRHGYFDYDAFSIFYRQLAQVDHSELESQFMKYSTNSIITNKQFQSFLENEQKMNLCFNEIGDIIRTYSTDSMLQSDAMIPFWSVPEFIDFLFSPENTIWDAKWSEVCQDMSQPLNRFWIASSHNTYLTGNQFKSKSSVECYIRCLRSGCRCVELDCWDGPDGKPVIYHGHTWTSQIKFVDVVRCIKSHAFVTSQYPVILSIENHCSVKQQRIMATCLKNILGDMLLKEQVNENEVDMPSPEQLKRKIILKHKKMNVHTDISKPGADESDRSIVQSYSLKSNYDNEVYCELSDSLKTGELLIFDSSVEKWKKCLVILTTRKLNYIFQENDDAADEDDKKENNSPYRQTNELHYGETWFHGNVKRSDAVNILLNHPMGNGTFLVRQNTETLPPSYILSFLYGSIVYHSQIKQFYEESNGIRTYQLNSSKYFCSLYELIDHYKTHPLTSNRFPNERLYLRHGALCVSTHEDEPWFHKELSRARAEAILRNKLEGTFLVRHSETKNNQFVISFRVNNTVKHCCVKREGRLYFIGNQEFTSLRELINYCHKNPFYKQLNLKYPIAKEAVCGQSAYLRTNSIPTQIKAIVLYDYNSNTVNELTLRVGDSIRNIVKHDDGWWQGDLGQQRGGYFPFNFVKEIIDNEHVDDIEPKLRSIDLDRISISLGEKPQIKIGDFIIKALTEDEQLEWAHKIDDVINSNRNIENVNRKMSIKVAPELNQCVVYCRATSYTERPTDYREMCSFRESKILEYLNSANFKEILQFTQRQLIRVYPEGIRINSSNYNPMLMWNCAIQMVALNYQTKDKPMQLNRAKFRQNGNCGYVLMPQYMQNVHFDPFSKPTDLELFSPIVLTVKVICARNLNKNIKGILSPSVEVEVVGTPIDSKKYLTKIISDNGLCPSWSNEQFVFDITYPELSLIRFVVYHRDTFDESSFVGQATYPIECIRQGFRNVRLQNEYSECFELATLLVHIDVRPQKVVSLV